MIVGKTYETAKPFTGLIKRVKKSHDPAQVVDRLPRMVMDNDLNSERSILEKNQCSSSFFHVKRKKSHSNVLRK